MKEIKFKIFDAFLSGWNQFHCNDLDSDDKFRTKKSIKSWFDQDTSQNFSLGWIDRQSLQFWPTWIPLKPLLRQARVLFNKIFKRIITFYCVIFYFQSWTKSEHSLVQKISVEKTNSSQQYELKKGFKSKIFHKGNIHK